MALTPRLDLRQSQSLVMTPQLQQAIKLLQLSSADLAAYVEEELQQNPMLEPDDRAEQDRHGAERERDGANNDDGPAPGDGIAEDSLRADTLAMTDTDTMPAENSSPLDIEHDTVWSESGPGDSEISAPQEYQGLEAGSLGPGGRNSGGNTDFSERTGNLEATLSEAPTLRAHLTGQLVMDVHDPVDRFIGAYCIEALDESGWLTETCEQVAEKLSCSLDRVKAVLDRLHRFDPPGIFARNLRECLALQLRDLDRLDPAMEALLDNLELLAKHDQLALLKACGVDAEDLADMVAEIRALNPKPAQAFDHEVVQTVTPDILMRPHPDGGWTVELNSETLPRVLVNSEYYARIRRDVRNKQEREYINDCFHSANWLVKALHQRATTILKVASEIVRQQDAFFRKGIEHMKPLVLRDIAEEIEMHESTVSRVTSNKYIHTPRGLFELKYFFSAAISDVAGGTTHSAEAVRFRIKSLIEAETPREVLSDDRVVEILKEDGVDIARRTVAKYREAMKIPSSVQRRRIKNQAF